ncbi:hypothetical protein GCM10009555_099620 [Acrocarpospora macrocephala]|uniref:Uncharacterized protein n=1 Tax=Acrocarpospora macrocephala TaxID=150177 RepID=A0A5M3X0C8_9ACTN|nr:hypothetical protein [Acrocarpospora macrocephala]GES15187.1 hypothetical protein Amac_087840 [Acrocarpospora macrocephala]
MSTPEQNPKSRRLGQSGPTFPPPREKSPPRAKRPRPQPADLIDLTRDSPPRSPTLSLTKTKKRPSPITITPSPQLVESSEDSNYDLFDLPQEPMPSIRLDTEMPVETEVEIVIQHDADMPTEPNVEITIPPDAEFTFEPGDPLADLDEALRQRMPFRNLFDLADFTAKEPEMTKRLLTALRPPIHGSPQLARDWLAAVREVVPDQPFALAPYANRQGELWRVIGIALNLKEPDAAGMLAELYWTKPPIPPVDSAPIRKALGTPDRRAAFDTKLIALQNAALLPNETGMQRADMSGVGYDQSVTRPAADEWLKTHMTNRQKDVQAAHPVHDVWLKEMGEDPNLRHTRALDRLSDVLQTLEGNRVCVALLHKDREIGVFANFPDGYMGQDLEMLLRASRALNDQDAEKQVQDILALMRKRRPGREELITTRAKQRFEVRLRKSIEFLRALEEQHGRIRAVPYAAKGKGEIHAEMRAVSVARARPGVYDLGVGKLCCLKCWLILTDVLPNVFKRKVPTHRVAYAWPPPDFLTEPDLLRLAYNEPSAPLVVQKALRDSKATGVLVNVYSGAKSGPGEKTTEYASSEEDPGNEPWPTTAENTEAFETYLDDEVLRTDERPAGDLRRLRLTTQAEPKLPTKPKLKKVKGVPTPTSVPDDSGSSEDPDDPPAKRGDKSPDRKRLKRTPQVKSSPRG